MNNLPEDGTAVHDLTHANVKKDPEKTSHDVGPTDTGTVLPEEFLVHAESRVPASAAVLQPELASEVQAIKNAIALARGQRVKPIEMPVVGKKAFDEFRDEGYMSKC